MILGRVGLSVCLLADWVIVFLLACKAIEAFIICLVCSQPHGVLRIASSKQRGLNKYHLPMNKRTAFRKKLLNRNFSTFANIGCSKD